MTAKSKKKFTKYLIILVFVLLLGLVFLFIGNQKLNAPANNDSSKPQNNVLKTDKAKSNKLRLFTPDEFKDMYNNFAYPNAEQINESTPITGNTKADARIRQLAEARGYRLRSAPVTNAFVEVSDKNMLQQRAASDWQKLFLSAKKSKINLSITEALRSAKDQKTIFLRRLGNISPDSIASGLADAQVNSVLEKTAPPGYSRHHSGYTIDLVCDNQPAIKFENSVCFEWLNKNNYQNAKQYGWIPSYPEGTKLQGPEPESWEYVWVGLDSLVL
ncbi:D-alanyl-D-alanine carboxypeptidase family protein [Candidatus Parcubacteria bacterium]|nr:D-alanyl-D-alanine carboxypeptidase family protein [Candidatus Parcubacteria bacterium]